MKSINFSIIIPHYNVPVLLSRAINSIPQRDDIQIIVVDDCSPNAQDYKQKYEALRRADVELYYTSKGGSAGRARNLGIEKAKGKWLIFLDSDDLFVDNASEILDATKDRAEDVVYYNYKRVFSNDLTKKSEKWNNNADFVRFKDDHNEAPFRYSFHPIWSKIIRKTLVDKYHIRCDETRWGNDVAFSLKCGIHAQNIAVINEPFFIITERPDSLAVALSNKSGPSPFEYETRLKVSVGCQAYIDKYIPQKGIKRYYEPTASAYLHYHKKNFFCSLFKLTFQYPRIAFDIWRFAFKAALNKMK